MAKYCPFDRSYDNGCRCTDCRAENARRHSAARKKRQARIAAGQAHAVPHGETGYSNWGCRCEACSTAWNKKMKRDRAARFIRSDEAPHGTLAGANGWGCQCRACRNAANAAKTSRNDKSRLRASRNGYQWTGPELEIASRADLSASQVAAMIGRTIAAVQKMRDRLDVDPRKDVLAGVPLPPPARLSELR